MSHANTLLVLIVAGEVSGDILGGELMLALRKLVPAIRFAGIGGEKMQAAGLQALGALDEFPGMGLVEVVGAIPRVLRLRNRLVAWAETEKPALVITVDNQEFSKQLAGKLAPRGFICVQYVAPKVWAWRQGRVKKLQRIFAQMLCLFPFEVDFFTRHGLPATYVGHPVAQRMAPWAGTQAQTGVVKLALLPGSRRAELMQHWPLLVETFQLLRQQHPLLRGVLALPDEAAAARCKALAWAEGIDVILGEARFAALQECRAALTKSGTNNLELVLLRLPAVVVYRLHWLSWAILSRVVKVKAVSPVNLVANGLQGAGGHLTGGDEKGPVYPEYLQGAVTAAALAGHVQMLLADTPERVRQMARLAEVKQRLVTPEPPAEMAARVIREAYLPPVSS